MSWYIFKERSSLKNNWKIILAGIGAGISYLTVNSILFGRIAGTPVSIVLVGISTFIVAVLAAGIAGYINSLKGKLSQNNEKFERKVGERAAEPEISAERYKAAYEMIPDTKNAEKSLLDQLKKFQLLRQLFFSFSEALDLTTLSEMTYEILPKYIDKVDRTSLLIYDKSTDSFFSAKKIGPLFPAIKTPQLKFLEKSLPGKCFSEGREIYIDDCSLTELIPEDYVKETGMKSSVAVPVIFKNEKLGIVRFDNNQTTGCYGEDDIEFFRLIADQMAIIIENANLITNLKKANQLIEENERYQKILLDSMSTCIMVVDSEEQIIIDINDNALHMLGYAREEVIGKVCHQFICPAEAGRCVVIDLHQTVDLSERVVIDKACNKLPVLKSVRKVKRGEKELLIESFVDITNLKEAERALRESEEKLRIVFDSLFDIVVSLDESSIILSVSPSIQKMLGYSPEEMIGAKINDLQIFDAENAGMIKTGLTELMEIKSNKQTVLTFIHKNGERRTGEMISTYIETGYKPMIVSVIRDITERIKAEEMLRKSEKQVRLVWEFSREGLRLANKNGIIVMANDAFCKMVRMSRSEIEGRHYSIIYDAGVRNKIEKKFSERFNSKKISHYFESEHTLWNGEKVWFEGSHVLFEVEDQEPLLLSAFREISERKRSESEIKQFNQDLVVLNKKLNESELRLMELNASKDRLFSIIAHDLKNPFTSLLGFSNFLVNEFEDLSDEEIKQFAGNIHNSAKTLFVLLENLLKWSRLQLKNSSLAPSDLNLFELVNDIFDIFMGNSLKKKITLSNCLEKDTHVFADKNVLQSVIQNLVSNAIKFSHTGGEILVSSKLVRDFLEISVADNGVGISDKDMAKLFRIDMTHTTAGTGGESGTGLGLLLCKEMVEKSGGTINVKSKFGEGACFAFTIPPKEEVSQILG